MSKRQRNFDAIEVIARWLLRRDQGLTPREEAEFAAWCQADPRHAAAVTQLSLFWSVFDQAPDSNSIRELRARLQVLERRRRRRWRR